MDSIDMDFGDININGVTAYGNPAFAVVGCSGSDAAQELPLKQPDGKISSAFTFAWYAMRPSGAPLLYGPVRAGGGLISRRL
jgi:hypothetical protein